MSFSATFRRLKARPAEAWGALQAWWRAASAPTRREAPAEDAGPASLTDAAFLRTLDRLALQTQRRLRGDNIGQRASYRRLPASDFREHRVYQPGDDLRHVDWNASARAEHVFIKMGEQTKEASIHLLLDSSASMQWGQPSKLWAGRRLAAALGFIALNYGDRLLVEDVASSAPTFGPKLGKAHVPSLLRHLRELPLQRQADLTAAAGRYARAHPRGGFVVLISDLADVTDLGAALRHWRPPTWQVLVVHLLHPAELEPTLRGEIELQDAETSERANYDLDAHALERYHAFVGDWCAGFERACLEHGASYARLLADAPLETSVLPYLRRRGAIDAA
jgi:uncharacterized protein (DUF58 family)